MSLLFFVVFTEFGTMKIAWETRETPFQRSMFVSAGVWLAVQMTRSVKIQFGIVGSKRARFLKLFVSRFGRVFTLKSGLLPSKDVCFSLGQKKAVMAGA